MKTYVYATDAEIGAVQADSVQTVIDEIVDRIEAAEGGWGWVEDEDGNRIYIEWDYDAQRVKLRN